MKTILVVDDEDDLRVLVAKTLKSRGFETIEADNGATAFDLAKKHMPDLIVSDVMMDSGNGFMLQELLRDDPKTASIPLILMSGLAQKAGAWGSDPDVEYLEKPFSDSILLNAVGRKINPQSPVR